MNSHIKIVQNNVFLLLIWLFIAKYSLLYTQANEIIHQPSKAEIETSKNPYENLAEKLAKADKNRLLNPALFHSLMKELSQQQNSLSKHQHELYNYLEGYRLGYIGRHSDAEKKLLETLASSTSEVVKFRARYTLINIAAIGEKWAEGLQLVSNNLSKLHLIQEQEHKNTNFLASIIFYNQIRQHGLALKYIDELNASEISIHTKCFLNQFEIEARYHLNDIGIDDRIFENSLKVCMQAKNIIGANLIRLYKAKLLLKQNAPLKALKLITPNMEEIKNTLYAVLIAGMHNTLSEAYFDLNDLDEAHTHALKALNINKNNSSVKRGMDSYDLLYKIAKIRGEYAGALSLHEKYSELDKAYLEGEKAKHLAFQLAEHQAFEQEAEIKLLNEQNTLLETKQALSEAEVANTRLVIAFLVVSLILIALWGGRLYKAHKRIKELAEYDALTGIFNRGHFTHVANSALKYCQNAEQDISVIIFDLDHFKTVNDSYGHATGDWALKEATRVCKNLGRKNDIFARLGGEEFCILLPSCNIRSAALRAEECRHAIEDIITEASGHDFRITASFGVTDAKTSGFNLEKLLADADEAAYTSKHSGRNRVTVYEIENTPKQAQLDGSWSIT